MKAADMQRKVIEAMEHFRGTYNEIVAEPTLNYELSVAEIRLLKEMFIGLAAAITDCNRKTKKGD